MIWQLHSPPPLSTENILCGFGQWLVSAAPGEGYALWCTVNEIRIGKHRNPVVLDPTIPKDEIRFGDVRMKV